jgi:hypothetical protein
MTRASRTLFGSFSKLLSAGVFANDWWLFRASEVELEGQTRVSHELVDTLAERAAELKRPSPERIDLEWFRNVAPIGLQFRVEAVEVSPFLLGFVACRVQDDRPTGGQVQDMVYPFFFAEQQGRLVQQFSAAGPALDIRRQIVVAVGQRLLPW